MDLELTDDQEFFRDTTRKFLESECPLTTVRQWHETARGFDDAWWRQAAELGWTSMLVPEALGGGNLSGRPVADAAIVAEEMGRLASPGPFLPVNLVASALAAGGTDRQRHEVLPGLLSGEAVATWAFAEPGGGWLHDDDGDGHSLTIDAEGDDLVVHGTKAYVEAAAEADHFLVTGRTGDGLSQVLVPAGTAGVTVTAGRSLDLVRRFGEVRFDGVRVPASAAVGPLGSAGDAVEHQRQLALVLQCAETVGAVDRVFEFTIEYTQDRYAFGRPIASYQALKHRIADMLLWLESCKGTTDAAVRAVDDGAGDAATLVSVAKAYVGDKAPLIMSDCLQLHGGIGITWEHDLHLYMRRAALNRALYGTPEEHRDRICTLLGDEDHR